jgi:hypothetical protein
MYLINRNFTVGKYWNKFEVYICDNKGLRWNMFHDKYTHNNMEIKSIKVINITGRDTGKNHIKQSYRWSMKNHTFSVAKNMITISIYWFGGYWTNKFKFKITHTWYYSGHRIASTKLLDPLHEDPDHSNPNNMYAYNPHMFYVKLWLVCN